MSSKSQFIEKLKVENGKLKFNKISVCRPVRNPHKPLALPLGELSPEATERAVGGRFLYSQSEQVPISALPATKSVRN